MRLDAPITLQSRFRLLFYAALLAIFLPIAWLAGLAIWQFGLVLLSVILISSFIFLSKPALLQLSQPPLHLNARQNWQLLMRTARGDQLWQGDLLRVRAYSWVVIAEVQVIEPYQRSLTFTIFRDQMTADDWRKLSILGQLMA